MSEENNKGAEEKSMLHPRSKHRQRYDFKSLNAEIPQLKHYVTKNKYGNESINFADPRAVKTLNQALLKMHYGIENWDVPHSYLSPPIPGRADYIHNMADLIALSNGGELPKGEKIRCVDVGIGASCIYPIIGHIEYGWKFTGTDIDEVSLKSSKAIINSNESLKGAVELRHQPSAKDVFFGVLKKDEFFDLSICNPPFHSSQAEATKVGAQKVSNLSGVKTRKAVSNFGGKGNELWCEGGEKKFVRNMVRESKKFGKNIFWFSTLVSKETNLEAIYKAFRALEVVDMKTLPMAQGNKVSRIVAWTFLSPQEQTEWVKRWQ
ncbi:MAG: 23S rRNA (adenine1618-N6)-methyltransferase [Flavobacteriales bacterium]|jgi:23S rRNA (adenine1618-N6)-methyltransferase